jgi:hypothetical protein
VGSPDRQFVPLIKRTAVPPTGDGRPGQPAPPKIPAEAAAINLEI